MRYPRCAGIDVHKRTAVVTIGWVDERGQRRKQTRTFGTMTADLERLAAWLVEQRVTHAAMESTGVYWKPVFNLLEPYVEVVLANAAHVKAVPGRKTDVRDSEWLLDLMQHGLIRGGFIPEAPIRALRDLTRHRTSLIGERTRALNRGASPSWASRSPSRPSLPPEAVSPRDLLRKVGAATGRQLGA